MFFFKKKTIVLTCVTNNPTAHEFFKIKLARNFVPDWWKQIPQKTLEEHLKSNSSNLYPEKTLRTCPGFITNYKHGVIMPLWTDLIVELGNNENSLFRWQFADGISSANEHPVSERGKFLPPNKFSHLKLSSPWLFYCKESIPWIATGATWNNETPDDYFCVPGISEFKYQHTTNPNLFLIRKKNIDRILISAGQPILHFIPLSDKKIQVKCELVSDAEYSEFSKKNGKKFSFINSYILKKSLQLKNGDK